MSGNKIVVLGRHPERRDIPGMDFFGPQYIQSPAPADVVLIEPLFKEFRKAGGNELGLPFLAINNMAAQSGRMTVFLSYSQANASTFKGYLQDVQKAMKEKYGFVTLLHIPYITTGLPMNDSVLALTGSNGERHMPHSTKEVVMPSQYLPDLLSHVARNRPNFPLLTSSRSIGAVRSDLNLLPPADAWGGRSLMVEYKDGVTTSIQRMKGTDVGKIWGVKPCQYTDDLSLCVPAPVLQAFG